MNGPQGMGMMNQAIANLAQFHMKFNYQRGIDHPFTVIITYNKVKNIPINMQFVEFDRKDLIENSINCKHNCVQNKRVRFFIKNVPPGVKPFSLRLEICPDCHAPVSFQFIVYPGDLKKYPRVRDLSRLKNKIITPDNDIPIPKALIGDVQKIGVK